MWIGKRMAKQGTSAVLAAAMVASLGSNYGFADTVHEITYPEGSRVVQRLDAPVEDGVYTASLNLMNANSSGQYSMGNAALRGSESFLQKHPDDTQYQALLVVEQGTATAIVEFMPMGYIGQYGFMMELESVQAEVLTKYGYPDDNFCTYTSAELLTQHRTQDGSVVYDAYNNPESEMVYDGSNPDTMTRPAGFGHDEPRLIDIDNLPYQHMMALDVTPVVVANQSGEFDIPQTSSEFTVNNAAYVHVFVPIMFSISPTSGDQYARLQVDWSSLTEVENAQENVSYQLWKAKNISKGNYTESSYQALQETIEDVSGKLTNIWPDSTLEMSGAGFQAVPVLNQKEFTVQEQQDMASAIAAAISELEEKGDKTSLRALIEKADVCQESQYTPETWEPFQVALAAAKQVERDDNAGVSEVTRAVSELENALEALVKRANTDELKTILEQASVLKNEGYTQATWSALQQAIDHAQRVLDNANATQSEVDAQVQALQTAMDNLRKEGELDRHTLEDGVYSVYGEMFKTNQTDYSMSNDAIHHTLKLTVEDGKYYLTMDFQGLSYLNKYGYLAELAYYENGYQYGAYGDLQGTVVPATVLSTQKNPDGTDIVDEFNQAGGIYAGKLYPDQIKFPLVSDALEDEQGFVPLQVFVPVMEDISAGSGTQDVLLKLDWSTLKKTTEDDPNFQPEEPVEQSPAVNVTDTTTGIKVEADKGVFPEGVQQVVTQITSGEVYEKAAELLADVGKKFRLFEIHFELNGVEVQPNGVVTVYYPIPEGYDADKVVLYRINEDGTKTLVKGTVENGYYKVLTKTFSTYALVEQGSTITDAENSANVNGNPDTGDRANVAPFVVLTLSCVGLMGILLARKKEQ